MKGRQPTYPIHPLILSRTSPRQLSDQPVSREELLALFEAARWAPSFYNQQPWRFIYALKNTTTTTTPDKEEPYPKFYDLLWQLNRQWAYNTSALVVVVSHKWFHMKGDRSYRMANPTHSFDTGAACMALALEGAARDLVVHAMAGFDYDRAYELLGIDRENDQIDCMLAIAKRPPPELREEPRIAPRQPLESIAFEHTYDISKTNNTANVVIRMPTKH
ncbi:uncharacterized protein LOC128951508 [Oppia nitens]|uniref:uncharacterized protein LOC128951508 n=1 Tax=Oppia nitens TaxID=1686743 RepID=UPI0023DB8287|nr:uncharacterized protein LOC128951508 [Oppia nitens]